MAKQNFNPRSPCGERLGGACDDVIVVTTFQSTLPVRGATRQAIPFLFQRQQFQSTLPVRGATLSANSNSSCRDFNPRSPCGERPSQSAAVYPSSLFQSTLPVRGATRHDVDFNVFARAFQSTLPVRGATLDKRRMEGLTTPISIHAPRAGSDGAGSAPVLPRIHYFNPRSPCGERLDSIT